MGGYGNAVCVASLDLAANFRFNHMIVPIATSSITPNEAPTAAPIFATEVSFLHSSDDSGDKVRLDVALEVVLGVVLEDVTVPLLLVDEMGRVLPRSKPGRKIFSFVRLHDTCARLSLQQLVELDDCRQHQTPGEHWRTL